MDLNEELDMIFEQFISNTVSYARLKSIKNSVTLSNIDILMRKIESLDDPSAYCKNDFDSKTPDGFFQDKADRAGLEIVGDIVKMYRDTI